MKILVNRKIKRLFLCILLAVSAFALALAPALCLGGRRAALWVALAAAAMTLVVLAALAWYFWDQSKTLNAAIAQIRDYTAGNRNARIVQAVP